MQLDVSVLRRLSRNRADFSILLFILRCLQFFIYVLSIEKRIFEEVSKGRFIPPVTCSNRNFTLVRGGNFIEVDFFREQLSVLAHIRFVTYNFGWAPTSTKFSSVLK